MSDGRCIHSINGLNRDGRGFSIRWIKRTWALRRTGEAWIGEHLVDVEGDECGLFTWIGFFIVMLLLIRDPREEFYICRCMKVVLQSYGKIVNNKC